MASRANVDKVQKLFQQNAADGSFRLNLDYFSFLTRPKARITRASSNCSALPPR